jgi:hypothetical protein
MATARKPIISVIATDQLLRHFITGLVNLAVPIFSVVLCHNLTAGTGEGEGESRHDVGEAVSPAVYTEHVFIDAENLDRYLRKIKLSVRIQTSP